MAQMSWRILAGLEDTITVSFMEVGHTRCAVDGGFGLAKKKYRASDTAQQLAELVSASAEPNDVCYFEWEWRNWDSFLSAYFKKVPGLSKYLHFVFSAAEQGMVKKKATCEDDDAAVSICLRRIPIAKSTSP